MPSLRTTLHGWPPPLLLASSIPYEASVSTINVAEAGVGVRRGPGRPNLAPNSSTASARVTRSGRLKRRSPEEIARALDEVIALVKKHKSGLRAEQIRAQLKMDRKEMPRVLHEGLSSKKLKSKGQKRATTYVA